MRSGSGKMRSRRSSRDLGDGTHKGDALGGTLYGARAMHFSLKGSGVFRAAYVVLEVLGVCLVFMISTRENFYREAQRCYAALQFSHEQQNPMR